MGRVFQADLAKIIAEHPRRFVAVIGHSFAAIPMLELAAKMPVNYLGLIDPVSCKPFVDSWPMPMKPKKKPEDPDVPVCPCDWFQRTHFGMEKKMTVEKASEPIYIDGHHNDLPHLPAVIDRLVAQVLSLSAPTVTAT